MTTGAVTPNVWTLVCVLSFLLLYGGPGILPAEKATPVEPKEKGSWTLQQLAAVLRKNEDRTVVFEETRFSPLLTEPLRLSGSLIFTAPSRFEKRVTDPYRESYIVDNDRVSFESQETGAPGSLPLERYPSLQGFIEGLRAVFTGDVATLQEFFNLSLDGDRAGWTLTLEPVHRLARETIDSIKLTGHEGQLRRIEMWETNGDYSRIEIASNTD